MRKLSTGQVDGDIGAASGDGAAEGDSARDGDCAVDDDGDG